MSNLKNKGNCFWGCLVTVLNGKLKIFHWQLYPKTLTTSCRVVMVLELKPKVSFTKLSFTRVAFNKLQSILLPSVPCVVLTQHVKIGEQQPGILASNQHTDHISLQFYIYLLCLSALPCLVSPVFCVCLSFKRTVNCATSVHDCVYPLCVCKLGKIGCIANVLLATINLCHILKGFWLKQSQRITANIK